MEGCYCKRPSLRRESECVPYSSRARQNELLGFVILRDERRHLKRTVDVWFEKELEERRCQNRES